MEKLNATQEQRDLLLKDICARLPHRVKVDITYSKYSGSSLRDKLCFEGINILDANILGLQSEVYIKPYLFPLSSMTKEQEKEYCSLVWFDGLSAGCNRDDAVILNEVGMLIDFYHKNHLDYRGLIPMGLAIDATGLNIY